MGSSSSPRGEQLQQYRDARRRCQQPSISWLAGSGVKAGLTYGETDAVGLRTITNPVDTHGMNATILNQLGLNHVNLTFLHEGRSERPTVVYGQVVKDILA